MRSFVWDCFQVTGSIDAYLLYKEFEGIAGKLKEIEPVNLEEEETN